MNINIQTTNTQTTKTTNTLKSQISWGDAISNTFLLLKVPTGNQPPSV